MGSREVLSTYRTIDHRCAVLADAGELRATSGLQSGVNAFNNRPNPNKFGSLKIFCTTLVPRDSLRESCRSLTQVQGQIDARSAEYLCIRYPFLVDTKQLPKMFASTGEDYLVA